MHCNGWIGSLGRVSRINWAIISQCVVHTACYAAKSDVDGGCTDPLVTSEKDWISIWPPPPLWLHPPPPCQLVAGESTSALPTLITLLGHHLFLAHVVAIIILVIMSWWCQELSTLWCSALDPQQCTAVSQYSLQTTTTYMFIVQCNTGQRREH